jgi:hypothetical protein
MGKEVPDMSDNRISPDIFSTDDAIRRDAAPRASLAAQLVARIRAGRFDRMLAVGVPAPQGSALAVHEARLTSAKEREDIARALRQSVLDAKTGGTPLSSRVPVDPDNVAEAESLIDEITLRLHSPRPVSARGMARLRALLSDGCGPLYRFGRGDLKGRLGAALAEL